MTESKRPEDYGITKTNIDHIFSLEHRINAQTFTVDDVNSLTSAYAVSSLANHRVLRCHE